MFILPSRELLETRLGVLRDREVNSIEEVDGRSPTVAAAMIKFLMTKY